MDWEEKLAWAEEEHERRLAGPRRSGEREDFRLAAVAGASWAGGLAALMAGRPDEAEALLGRAADEYLVSWDAAPAGSWGRPIALLRCRLLAGHGEAAERDARRVLAEGALDADGPIAAYCACLALLVLGDPTAKRVAASLRSDPGFQPGAVADALHAIARHDEGAYADAAAGVLASFEERDAFLEDVPVADTVLVLDALARARGLRPTERRSDLLPARER
ncbi:MAG: hypothetical protein OEV72_07645 [Thermoleophilia bacterium]|nr:hypothetical protein [Thermoleophilia bacterium]MDH5333589.1 hypothetical protein [Thermoleophilia bacterium]